MPFSSLYIAYISKIVATASSRFVMSTKIEVDIYV